MTVCAAGRMPDGKIVVRYTCRCGSVGEWRASLHEADIDGSKHRRDVHGRVVA